jgi:hypothetical protein
MEIFITEEKPIKITKTTAYAKLDYSPKNRLGVRYYTDKKVYSRKASYIRDLRIQFSPFCDCELDKRNPDNFIIDYDPDSKDFVYQWHFAHRHGFPSDLNGSGRGMAARVQDIINHPLSYLLLCSAHHEDYDKESGEWKNPNYRSNR